MARIDVRYVNWKVLLDGVEVPWVSFTVGVGVDTAGTASIVLEPDPILYDLRPSTMVHIFMYDNFEGRDDEDEKYKLFWEGEVAGYGYSKTAQSRAYILNAEGSFSIFGKSKLFAHGLGPIATTSLVTGSALYPGEITQGQLFNLALFGKAFGEKGVPVAFDAPIHYSERMIGLIAFLSSYNALLRLHAVRSGIFCKLASISDNSLGRLIPKTYIYPWSEQLVNSKMSDDATVLDLIGSFNKWIFHHFVSIAGPAMPMVDRSNIKPIYYPTQVPDDNLYAFARKYLRNDYLLTPELYYAIPPACNFIFPEFFHSIDLTRQFSSEYTRAVLIDVHIKGNVAVVAPDSIQRFAKTPLPPAEFWSINKTGLLGTGTAESPYQSKSGNKVFNLLGAVSDAEIEKGIIPIVDFPPFEYFSGVSNVFDLADKATQDKIGENLKEMNEMSLKIYKGAAKESTYIFMMKALADYTYSLNRFKRSVSLELTGHRWIVPGFPCVIFDSMMSYIGYVKAYTFSVSQNGQETGGISLDFVRPFPRTSEGSVRAVADLEKVTKGLSEVSSTLSKYKVDVDSSVQSLNDNLSRVMRVFDVADQTSYKIGVIPGVSGLHPVKKEPEEIQYTLDTEGTSYICAAYERMARAVRKDPNRLSALGVTDLAQYDEDCASLKYYIPSPILTNTGKDDAVGCLERLVDIVERYYNLLVSEANEAVSSGDASRVSDAVLPNNASTSNLKKSMSNLDLTDKFPEDFFVPPIFGNFDFMGVESAEKIYKELIGSRPILTSLSKSSDTIISGLDKVIGDTNSPTTILALRASSYAKFMNFAKTIEKIFPIRGGSEPTEWGDRVQRPDSSDSVRVWAEDRFLRRTNLQSMKDFVAMNGLEKTTRNSSPPVQQSFIVLKPKTSYQIGDLWWDDSIYSKIVDEFRIAPRDVTIRDEKGKTTTIPQKAKDPVIDAVRESVKLEMLTTRARQEFWIRYAREHFGSRAISSR